MIRNIKTRVKDGAPQVETELTINFDGVTVEELQAGFARSLVIDEQNKWRKAGSIPTKATVNVREELDAPRAPRGPMDPKIALQKFLATLDPEARKAWIAENL